MKCAPILLIGFNRPDFTALQISRLKPLSPDKLYFVVDGPRADKPTEIECCLQVRSCTKLIDWPCEVQTLFRDQNLGCKDSVSGAITWFFENEESGIIIEDDCSVGADFIRFASELLEYYRDDERVGAISAMNRYDLQSNSMESYHFNTHIDVWGWASWRRVWKDYNTNILQYEKKRYEIVNRGLRTRRARRAALKSFEAVVSGLSTWDYQLGFMFMDKGLLSISPKEKLVANIGFCDNRGTNVAGYNFDAHFLLTQGRMDFPLVHPSSVIPDIKKITMEERREYGLLPRALTVLGNKLPKISLLIDRIGRLLERFFPVIFKI